MSATLKPVGHGPSGTPAYVVLDERGKYVTSDYPRARHGAFLFTLREAQAIKERYDREEAA